MSAHMENPALYDVMHGMDNDSCDTTSVRSKQPKDSPDLTASASGRETSSGSFTGQQQPMPILVPEDESANFANGEKLTRYYVLGDNRIDFRVIYKQVRELKLHPGRGELEMDWAQLAKDQIPIIGKHLKLRECSDEFIEHFFSLCATMVDYFTDFYTLDTSMMQAIWCRLWDDVQEAAKLPHIPDQAHRPSCSHAEEFGESWAQIIFFINRLLTGGLDREDDLVYANIWEHGTRTDLGAFRTGLKPWQQFLNKGSPGFGVGTASRNYVHDLNTVRMGDKTEEIQVPMGALAIIDRHTQRMRKLTEDAARKDERDVDAALTDFDANALKLGSSFTYTSIDGRKTMVREMYPSNVSKQTPRRDPQVTKLSHDVCASSLLELDELAGDALGLQPFEHPSGNDQFQMWTVTQSERKPELADGILEGRAWDKLFNGPWKVDIRDSKPREK